MLRKRPLLAAAFLVALGLIFGATLVTGFGSWKGMNIAFGASNPTLGGPLPSLPNTSTLEDLNGSFVAISKAVQPTIVEINVKTEAPKISKNEGENPFEHFFGGDGGNFQFNFPQQKQGPEEGIGSGVIITSDGYILTNNHVVKDAAKKGGITVTMTDKRVFDARVIGTDPTTDIAVIKVDATNLPVAALGNSDDLAVGQVVLAVGNPLGLESTVTQGIVSSLHRPLDIFDEKGGAQGYGIANFIQTDAAINPGNSGGGLFDIKGEVVGINSAIASGTGYFAGYGFAVPINMAKDVAMDLIKSGKVNRGYIGVHISLIDQTTAQALGLDRPEGVLVADVQKGGAGEAAGLKQNDVILSVNGQSTDEPNELQSMIGMHHAGDRVTLRIWRNGKEMDKTVTLKPRDETADNASASPSNEEQGNQEESSQSTATLDNIGLSVRTVTSDDMAKFHVSNGVVITDVAPASEAADRAFPQGAVITEAAHEKVTSAGQFQKIINDNAGKAVGMTIVDSQGNSRFFAIKVPSE
ncbi:MAG TPA: Do family serine endopeptidase [Candidatus Kapabacteria bacterium]|nr:Do family serine endopeptidase [Candidatus Kapabacteria bacterium]